MKLQEWTLLQEKINITHTHTYRHIHTHTHTHTHTHKHEFHSERERTIQLGVRCVLLFEFASHIL